MILLLILAFIFIIIYEVPALLKNKSYKELAIFSFLLLIAFMISLMQILKIEIPNPVKNTQYFVKDLLHLSYD